MKILIYGAGVIGSIYAARLYESKNDITLLARGQRYDDLMENGVILHDSLTGRETVTHVPVIRQLDPDDFYDLIVVAVRMEQFDAVLRVLKGNTVCPLILLLFNNPGNIDQLVRELSPKHLILGFPGVGGTIEGHRIDYIRIRQQPTTIGEITGELSPLIVQWKRVLKKAGFPVTISHDIMAWLKTHAVFISCVAASIIRENGDSRQLGSNKSSIKKMVRSIREGLLACRSRGMPIAPANLKIIFLIMPHWFSVLYWQHAMKGKIGVLSMAPHVNAARQEMRLLAGKVIAMLDAGDRPTPSLDDLLTSFAG